jgi:2-polyprenyl-6-methoxyphenol hydroxylase-like FAD-dependent oxidoreductase
MTERRAVVVGAGIGGLAAAIALQRAGFRPIVLERAAELRELGFALLLAGNAVKALRLLGVAERVVSQSEVGRDGELRATDGRVLKHVGLDAIRRAIGEDAVCTLRQVLHGALIDALDERELRTGARAVQFAQSADGVEVALEGGEVVRGSLLVAADGLHSTVRAALHGDALRASGLVAYRGVCRDASWSVTGSQYFGRGVEAGVARAGGGSVYWYLSQRSHPIRDRLDPKQAALEIVRGFDLALVSLIERSHPTDIRRDALFDREPLRSWGNGRVTLLGDAAHPMLPHAGQGAAQALEDAVVLGRCLAANPDIPAALRRYEQLRLARTSQVVRIARRNARAGSVENRWLCALRDWLLVHGPASLMEKQLVSLARVELEV